MRATRWRAGPGEQAGASACWAAREGERARATGLGKERAGARGDSGRVARGRPRSGWVEAGAGWAETEEGGEWAAARVGPTWAAEMGWWVWVLGSFPFLILFSLSSISNSNKV